jgi:hypothetical protein
MADLPNDKQQPHALQTFNTLRRMIIWLTKTRKTSRKQTLIPQRIQIILTRKRICPVRIHSPHDSKQVMKKLKVA